MKLPEYPSFKDLWNYSCSQKKEAIKNKDYLPIIVASTISAASSWTMSNVIHFDINKLFQNFFTGLFIVLLVALGITVSFTFIVFFSLKISAFLNRIDLFSRLVWQKWRPFSKPKN